MLFIVYALHTHTHPPTPHHTTPHKTNNTPHTTPPTQDPRKVSTTYAAGDGNEEEPKAFVSVNWLLSESPLDMETELALGFLNYLLLGTSAAPLRKALNDSGLGESLIGGGIEDELVQPIFSVGLKGVKPEDKDKVEGLVLETLARLEKEGFTASAIEAAINTIEFSLRENNTGRFPRGLSLMLRAMGSWIYDRDPLRPLEVWGCFGRGVGWGGCVCGGGCVVWCTMLVLYGSHVYGHPAVRHTHMHIHIYTYTHTCTHTHTHTHKAHVHIHTTPQQNTPTQWINDLEHFKKRLESGEDVFGPLIRQYLLDNGHRVTVEMLPDTQLAVKQEEEEKQRLQVGCCVCMCVCV